MPHRERGRFFDLAALLVAVALVLTGGPVAAQEVGEDDVSDEVARIGLDAPPSLSTAKRRQAKTNGWALTGVAAFASGYDSNIYLGPTDTKDSAVFDLDAKLEGLFYPTRRDRIKVRLESVNTPYTAADNVDEFKQRVDAVYYHRFKGVGTYSLAGEFKHENDSATNSAGDSLIRDFEYLSYRAKTGFRWNVAKDQVLQLRYYIKRKDYFETPGLNSLDWWRHGPKVKYAYDFEQPVTLVASYEFQHQIYDEEDAANRDGGEPDSNPAEVHFFHTTRAGAGWRITPWVRLMGEFRFRRKDDRFDDFESYSDYRGEMAVVLIPIELLQLEAATKISHRNYDERPADTTTIPDTGALEYDRYRFEFVSRYEISDHFAIWSIYGFDKRDSNRIGTNSFRSYTQHAVSVGVTTAF